MADVHGRASTSTSFLEICLNPRVGLQLRLARLVVVMHDPRTSRDSRFSVIGVLPSAWPTNRK